MQKKKLTRRAASLTMAGLMVLSCMPAMAAPDSGGAAKVDPWSIADASKTDVSYTVDGDTLNATVYEDYYLNSDTTSVSVKQYKNAKVAVIVPEGADENSPILYMVNNGGWLMDSYSITLKDGSSYDTTVDGKANQAALALKNGYVVVEAGLRSRMDGVEHSPVTVADAKAVVRYLKHNDGAVGDTDRIFITGTSGGGALSAAIGSDGNSADFYEELYSIGAAGMESATESTIDDDVFGVVAYCPITDLGHADGSYDFAYAGTRQALLDSGYTDDSAGFSLSNSTMAVSPELAEWWAGYVNGLGLTDENGEALTAAFDKEKLEASGTLYDGMKNLLIKCFQKALDESSKEEMLATLETRTVASGYLNGTPKDGWQTDWITFSEDGKTIEDIDMDGCLYYVALGEVLKNAPAFTNQGTAEEARNENNLFGQESDIYGYMSDIVFNLNTNEAFQAKYTDWDTYWNTNGELLTKQARMVDSIAYLTDEENGDSAPYWYVRHGSKDRDTSFANQTLLYYAMSNDSTIKFMDFAFAWNRKHEGSYDIEEGQEFMNNALADADPWSIGNAEKTDVSYTVDEETLNATVYEDYYLNKETTDVTESQYKNAKVAVIVPEGADENSPILYMVNNSGWLMNTYSITLKDGGTYDTALDGKANQAALALKNGYVVVEAGLRTRMDREQIEHSPVTVADAKAVIRYLKYNDGIVGDTDKIFITGTSGGGALSAAIGADGNSSDFYEELYAIGAAGMASATESTLTDDVYGVVAYCPITDLGHADGSYDFAYAGTRQAMLDSGYTSDSAGFSLSNSTLAVSPELAEWWAGYVNGLGLTDENGEALTAAFDKEKLEASGTLYDGMKNLLIKCFQDALDESSKEEMLATLETRTVASGYLNGTPKDGWQTDWITFSEDGRTIKDIDMDGCLYYVALGEVLKNAPAFTNQGTAEEARNENNLFGQESDTYGYLTDIVFNLNTNEAFQAKYTDWDTYWSTNGDLLTKQARMLDSIAYLTDKEDGDSAPYWYVRHGSKDRDTSFANQTLLYYAMINDTSIETVDFAFAWNRKHEGSYDIAEGQAFMNNALDDSEVVTGWVKSDGKWYYYNADGSMATGWLLDGGKWYYLNSAGVMQTGWVSVNGKWYYMNSSGAMVTGWALVNGKWYYMSSSGAMVTGWALVNGKWYYMNSSGAMVTGWALVNGKWYYMNSNGAMQTGWIKLNGKWYYLSSSGAMVTGTQKIGNTTYVFNSNGVWIG